MSSAEVQRIDSILKTLLRSPEPRSDAMQDSINFYVAKLSEILNLDLIIVDNAVVSAKHHFDKLDAEGDMEGDV